MQRPFLRWRQGLVDTARTTAVVLLLAVACLALGTFGAFADRVALVIGNGAYRNATPLPNPPQDAAAIATKLEGLGFKVTLAVDADLASMHTALADFGTAAHSAEAAVIFYAGHGLQVDGENYLIPIDARIAKRADLDTETLRASEIYSDLVEAGPDVAVLIFDACRNSPFVAAVSTSPGLASGSVSASAFVQRPNSAGMLIGFAAAPGAVAYDGGAGNSPYTTALLQWIDRPGLELGAMLRRVRVTVMELTRGAQVPWVEEALVREVYLHPGKPEALSVAGDKDSVELALLETIRGLDFPLEQKVAFKFYDQLTTGEATATLASASEQAQPADLDEQLAREGLIWLSIRRSTDTALLQSFVETFPDSPFAALAKDQIAKVNQDAEQLKLALSVGQDIVIPLDDTQTAVEQTPVSVTQTSGNQDQGVVVKDAAPLTVVAPDQDQAPVADAAPKPPSIELALGLPTEAMAAVQDLLTTTGFYNGPSDALFGAGTRSSIEKFQASIGLKPSGFLDQTTLRALVTRGAGPALRGTLTAARRDAIHLVASIGEKGAGAVPTVLRVATIDRNDAVHAYWSELALQFEADHPGNRVLFEHQPDSGYKATLLGMLGSDTPPDVMHTWGGGHLDALRAAGFVRDLTDEMAQGWALQFRPGALQTYSQNGRIYGAPSSVALVSLWVNTAKLAEAGIPVEQLHTWDGFLKAVSQLKAAGITPIAIGGGDRWPFQFFYGSLAQQLGGRPAFDDAVSGTGEGFLAPAFIQAGQRLSDLADLQPFQPDFLATSEGEAGKLFAKGGAAMVLTGNWRLNTMQWNWVGGPDKMKQQLRRLDFPVIAEGMADGVQTYGGADGYAVNSKAPDIAVELVRLLTSAEVETRTAELADSVPSVSGSDMAITDPFLGDVAKTLLASNYHQLYYDQELGPVAGEVVNDVALKLATDKIEAPEAAQAIETAWDQVLADRGVLPAAP